MSPFTITGVDFTGALYVKQCNGEESKVCATSRAVHLEVVTDLSVPTFLLAFRRFAACRSLPQVMMSDNATTYTSAAEELTELLSSENGSKKGTLVWGILGTINRLNKGLNREEHTSPYLPYKPSSLKWRQY